MPKIPLKHSNQEPQCPACQEKLLDAHPEIIKWFNELVKPKFQDCHISWSWRDQQSQNEAFAEGKSRLKWPNSKHNQCDAKGCPYAGALDLFKLNSNGMASWEWLYFKSIAETSKANNAAITWGGDWHRISDSDHFELTS